MARQTCALAISKEKAKDKASLPSFKVVDALPWRQGGGVPSACRCSFWVLLTSTSPVSSQGSQGEPACAMNLWLLAFLVACFVGTRVPAVHAPGTVYAIPTHLPQISCLPTILLCPPFACHHWKLTSCQLKLGVPR